MSAERTRIIALFEIGYRQVDIANSLNVSKQLVSKTIKRFKDLGHDGDRPGRGRKRSVRTAKNRQIIKKRVQRNPRISLRKVSRETGISDTSVRRMAKEDLGLYPYKLRKAQLLTEKNKKMRLERCRDLLARAAGGKWETILFTDEKLFTIEQAHNPQNHRIWSKGAPDASRIVERRQNPQSVMVWAGICATGKTPLVFVPLGTKINQEVYKRDILEAVVLPWAVQHFGECEWTYQQDSAPAHKAKLVQQWCAANFPGFISSKQWPPYSPDLNPMDYSVWSILEERVCNVRHTSIAVLKQCLLKEWDKISVEELRRIAANFEKRLKLCIKAKGGHFEFN